MRWFGGGGSALKDHDVSEAVFEKDGSDGALANQSWGQFAAVSRKDQAGATVFRLARNKGDDQSVKVQSARRCMKLTKILRHPCVLPFREGVEDLAGGEISFATDEVLPLPAWLERYGKDADPRTLAWGGHCVLQALSFLHSTKRCHGSLTPDAIFVTAAGDWKLWGFELATSLDPLAPNNEGLGFFRAHGSLVDDAYRAPERKRNDWEGMANNRVGASDVWALSTLLERAYAGRGGAPRELGVWLKRASNPEPSKRPSCDQILRGCPLFRGATLKELSGLQDLSATSLEDQITFFRNLEQATQRTTPDGQPCRGALDEALFRGACVHKLLPKLLATLDIALKETAEGSLQTKRACVQCALPLLVQIVAMLDDAAEKDDPLAKYALNAEKRVVQGIVDALETVLVIKDPVIRFEALKRVDGFKAGLTDTFINRKLFDALLLGFGDKNDDARLLTLMGMLAIAPRLSEKNRSDRLLRVVKRLEVDRSPKIRTNVVIFYGRLAPDLSEALRTKHALSAFVKALDDKVPFVRMAAVRALGACRDDFSPAYAARLIAPKLVPLALDPAKPVRDAAVLCLEAYLAVVRKAADQMTQQEAVRAKQEATKREAEAQKRQAEAPRPQPGTRMPQAPGTPQQQQAPPEDPTSPSGGWGLASWAGGVASSALGKVASAASEAAAGLVEAEDTGEPDVRRLSSAVSNEDVVQPVRPPPARKSSIDDEDDDVWGGTVKGDAPARKSSIDDDAWGNDDGWGDTPAKPVALTKASPKRPAARKVEPKKAPPTDDFFGDDSWGAPAKPSAAAAEDDDDPWGTKEPTPPPKPAMADRQQKQAQRRAELDAKRKARAAARATPAPKPAPAQPPAKLFGNDLADDPFGDDDAWGNDVPVKVVAPKEKRKAAARKPPAKKGGTLSLSQGMFKAGTKGLPSPKAKTEEELKREKLAKAAAAMKAAPAAKLPADDSMWDDF